MLTLLAGVVMHEAASAVSHFSTLQFSALINFEDKVDHGTWVC